MSLLPRETQKGVTQAVTGRFEFACSGVGLEAGKAWAGTNGAAPDAGGCIRRDRVWQRPCAMGVRVCVCCAVRGRPKVTRFARVCTGEDA